MQRSAFLALPCCACAIVLPVAAAPLHTVSILSDGRDELRFSSGSLVVKHFSWGLPTNLVVDATALPLVWNGDTSVPNFVPVTGDDWVKKTLGRDGAYAVQRADGFALAASDNPNGGDTYQFQLSAAPEANTTDWMHVLGAGATPGRMSFPGLAGYVPQAQGNQTTFSLTVDGTDELMVVNGNLGVRHLTWLNPTSLTINGVPQPLTFSDNVSNPIPLTLPDGFQFTQLGGRTLLYPVQTPVGLLIGADDELLGPDTYVWTIVAVPEPAGGLIVVIGALAIRARTRRSIQ
jgi:hypothetical protein